MKSLFAPIEVDHNIIFYQSKLEMIGRNEDRYFFLKKREPFSGEKFNSDLTSADWRPNYQQKNCDEMLKKLMKLFKVFLINMHLYRSVICQ